MGGPVTGGGARATLSVDTSPLASARAAVHAFATGVNSELTGINKGTRSAEASFSGLANSLRGVAAAFGVSLGVQTLVQMGKAVIAAEALATAYDRQGIAAANLAGGQGRLTALMEVYDKATGGIVDKASALSNVTKLMSVGFADNSQELDKFATAIRGISIAMGATQETVTQNLILELFTQRGARLDQLGLQYDKVRARADELQAADGSLTKQMAYQNAVLEQAIQRFGGLATSAAGAATGIEKTAAAWKNLTLEIGQASQGPLNLLGAGLAAFIDGQTDRLRRWMAELDTYIKLLRSMGMAGPWLTTGETAFVASAGARNAQRHAQRGMGGGAAPIIEGEREAKIDWARGVNDINRQLQSDIISAESDYGQQRADTIRNYQKGVAREERDFHRNRLRAELEQLDAIAGVWRDAARRESKAASDLARTIGRSQSDSAERIENARADAGERLVEMEEDYAKDREKAAEDHRDKMMSAAGRLDAVALLEERKRWARESTDAKEAHDEQRDDLKEQLDERIADERESLAESIADAQEAHDRQREEAREADALRIADMKADFIKRKAQEDEDRAIRLGDQAQDHADALAQAAAAQGERMAQLKRQALEERAQLDADHKEKMLALGVQNEAWEKAQKQREDAFIKSWDRVWKHMQESLAPPPGGVQRAPVQVPAGASFASGGLVGSTGLAYLHKNEFVLPAPAMGMAAGGNHSRSINIAQGAITVYGAPGQDEELIGSIVEERLVRLLEAV